MTIDELRAIAGEPLEAEECEIGAMLYRPPSDLYYARNMRIELPQQCQVEVVEAMGRRVLVSGDKIVDYAFPTWKQALALGVMRMQRAYECLAEDILEAEAELEAMG